MRLERSKQGDLGDEGKEGKGTGKVCESLEGPVSHSEVTWKLTCFEQRTSYTGVLEGILGRDCRGKSRL